MLLAHLHNKYLYNAAEVADAKQVEKAMVTTLNTITTELASNGVGYIALSEELLHEDVVGLLYYSPGSENEAETFLTDIDEVKIDNETFPFCSENVLHTDIHFSGRIPLYASENPTFGLDELPIERGMQNVRKFLSGDDSQSTMPSKMVSAETLLRELTENGATAVGFEKELFQFADDETFPLTVYMPPATGAELVENYDGVRFDGITYELNCTFTVSGPEFGLKVPLYADDNIIGMSPLMVEEGLNRLRDYIDQPKLGKSQYTTRVVGEVQDE